MPTVLPLQIRKAPTVYDISRTSSAKGRSGNGIMYGPRDGTFYEPPESTFFRRWNCGATGFEFVKLLSGTPTYRYYPSMNRYNWNDDFLYGTPTYADSSHSRYAFWQSVSPNLYSFLNAYHSGGLPANKLIKVWVSWDKMMLFQDGRQPVYSPGHQNKNGNIVDCYYTSKQRSYVYLPNSSAGVCCRYAIFS